MAILGAKIWKNGSFYFRWLLFFGVRSHFLHTCGIFCTVHTAPFWLQSFEILALFHFWDLATLHLLLVHPTEAPLHPGHPPGAGGAPARAPDLPDRPPRQVQVHQTDQGGQAQPRAGRQAQAAAGWHARRLLWLAMHGCEV